MNMNESDSTMLEDYKALLRDECALCTLGQFAMKMFDPHFQREAQNAEMSTEEYLAAYVWAVADAMIQVR
jgi:hypothetical protein